MPYIAIQSFPKDEETKQTVVEEINRIFLEVGGVSKKQLQFRLKK